jgi:iron complex transport system substrate-binding protein
MLIRGTRVAAFVLIGVIALAGLGTWALLAAIQKRVEPACLQRVAPQPFAGFWELQGAPAEGEPWVVAYDDGLLLTVEPGPRRLASALPGITEMIAFLGAGDRLVACTPYCDYPAAAVEGLERISVLPFDPEGVLSTNPDLLVVDRRLHRRDLEVIRRRVPGVLLLDTSRSLAHLDQSLLLLQSVLGLDRQASEAFADWHARYTQLLASIQARRPAVPPRVLVVAQWDPLYVLGRGSLIDDLLRICGCINVACDLESDASGTFPEELVLARRPDWILTPEQPMPERLRERWQHLPALQTGQLFEASADDLVRAGPRILAGLARLAEALLGPAPAGAGK